MGPFSSRPTMNASRPRPAIAERRSFDTTLVLKGGREIIGMCI